MSVTITLDCDGEEVDVVVHRDGSFEFVEYDWDEALVLEEMGYNLVSCVSPLEKETLYFLVHNARLSNQRDIILYLLDCVEHSAALVDYGEFKQRVVDFARVLRCTATGKRTFSVKSLIRLNSELQRWWKHYLKEELTQGEKPMPPGDMLDYMDKIIKQLGKLRQLVTSPSELPKLFKKKFWGKSGDIESILYVLAYSASYFRWASTLQPGELDDEDVPVELYLEEDAWQIALYIRYLERELEEE